VESKQDLRSALSNEFSLPKSCTDDSRLIEDLGFDSLRLLELIVFIEESAGRRAQTSSELEFPMLETIGDAIAYWDELHADGID